MDLLSRHFDRRLIDSDIESMSTESREELERKCREIFESAHDHARHNMDVADRSGHPELRGPSAQFLADYERIRGLSGREFCEAALAADERLYNETKAAVERHREEHAHQLRQAFEDLCRVSAQLLDAQDEFYSSIAKRGETREPSPMTARFRDHAMVLLADADRIRALTGEDSIGEATAALAPFESINMKKVKAELSAGWAATPLLRCWRRNLSDRLGRQG